MDEDCVKGDDETATTADMTQVEDGFSDSESEDDEESVFAAENKPRPPPDRLLYNGGRYAAWTLVGGTGCQNIETTTGEVTKGR